MRSSSSNSLRLRFFPLRTGAFTLIELLVVISIIAILAALLLPVFGPAKQHSQKTLALIEMRNLALAIGQYEQTYGRMPTSAGAAQASSPDFTYGTFNEGLGLVSLTGGKGQSLPKIGNNSGSSFSGYQAPNSEVMAILMDLTTLPPGVDPLLGNHAKNPQQINFTAPKMSGDTKSHGVGTDLVYRDPWGNPYIITLDMNGDDRCRDGLYSSQVVSGGPNGNGLIAAVPGTDSYEVSATVVIWSLGPDGNASSAFAASLDPNKDNVRTW